MKKAGLIFSGFAVGVINALFGAGGGMIVVPILTGAGLSQKEAQATAVSVILPLTAVTCVLYYLNGNLDFKTALEYIPLGFIGALAGSFALRKVSDGILKKVFALFLLWAGGRMIFK
ncbi:MAG: sulfite exporter TauE/SafE family protein [Acutalibacteraceae bacterium]|nr:sulfite exporter TauE/SafE family protein [Oscillospiraceae bacterium]